MQIKYKSRKKQIIAISCSDLVSIGGGSGSSNGTTATRVYGQAGSFNSGIANNGGISADSLWAPFGFAIDSTGRVYIADSGNNRVLFY